MSDDTTLGPVEIAVIAFPGGRATLVESAPGVSVEQVVSATEAALEAPGHVPQMQIRRRKAHDHRKPACGSREP